MNSSQLPNQSLVGAQVANVTEQLKGLSLQQITSSGHYTSTSSSQGVTGNKENSKKIPNESTASAIGGSKISLKAREFGREITNASAAHANGS
jgi:hypothetical protein